MKYLIVFWAMIMPHVAMAGPDRASILFGSEHFDATQEYREFNPGIFLTWERQFDYSIGVYQNSYSNVSFLASIGYNWPITPDFTVGAFGGLATYPGEGDRFRVSAGDVVPLAGLQTRYRNFFAQVIPGNGQSTEAVLAIGLTFSLR